MPTIEENKMSWGNPQNWKNDRGGDKWSRAWGNPDNQWVWTIFPRIRRYVPTGRILEIAPGFGRWTNYLKDLCEELVVVDLNELCIESCKERFSSTRNIVYYVNDGKTLDMLPDKSLDFVFSFDSLVHADDDVIEAYVLQIANKLKPDGVAWIHHSNMESYKLFFQRRRMFQALSLGFGRILGLKPHWRSWSMTARKFEQLVEKAGMQTVSQERINWGTGRYFLIDCISVFTPRKSKWARANRTMSNEQFMHEVHYARKLSALYGQDQSTN